MSDTQTPRYTTFQKVKTENYDPFERTKQRRRTEMREAKMIRGIRDPSQSLKQFARCHPNLSAVKCEVLVKFWILTKISIFKQKF